MTVQEGRKLVIPGRAKGVMPPPLSFRSEARNLAFQGDENSPVKMTESAPGLCARGSVEPYFSWMESFSPWTSFLVTSQSL